MKKVIANTGTPPGTSLPDEEAVFAGQPDVDFVLRGRCTTPQELLAAIQDVDVVLHVIEPFTREVFAGAPRLKGIVRYGIGLDTIDVDAATEHGVIVANFPDSVIKEVANHALMFILVLAKKVVQLDRAIRSGEPRGRGSILSPMGPIHGETLGLVAFGNIARQLARRAKALEMVVIAYDPYVDPAVFAEEGVESVSLEDLARRSDYVSCHLPTTAETRAMLDARFFGMMKPTAYFVNTSRGTVVNEGDLIAALREGRIAGAGLDVVEHEPIAASDPLCELDNVLLTPHSAAYSDATISALHRRAALSALAIARGGLPEHVVNPEVLDSI